MTDLNVLTDLVQLILDNILYVPVAFIAAYTFLVQIVARN